MSEDPKGFVIKTTLFRMWGWGSSLDHVAVFSSGQHLSFDPAHQARLVAGSNRRLGRLQFPRPLASASCCSRSPLGCACRSSRPSSRCSDAPRRLRSSSPGRRPWDAAPGSDFWDQIIKIRP